MTRLLLSLSVLALLAACGEEQKPYKAPLPQSGKSDLATPPLFQEQRDALDKAKEAGQVLEQAAKLREEAAEKATR
ncbi:MAG: hypothetical protein KGZ83_20585 [Sulfuricella sp.]|nr:hypothetical protein [Sulfuricella sp.]